MLAVLSVAALSVTPDKSSVTNLTTDEVCREWVKVTSREALNNRDGVVEVINLTNNNIEGSVLVVVVGRSLNVLDRNLKVLLLPVTRRKRHEAEQLLHASSVVRRVVGSQVLSDNPARLSLSRTHGHCAGSVASKLKWGYEAVVLTSSTVRNVCGAGLTVITRSLLTTLLYQVAVVSLTKPVGFNVRSNLRVGKHGVGVEHVSNVSCGSSVKVKLCLMYDSRACHDLCGESAVVTVRLDHNVRAGNGNVVKSRTSSSTLKGKLAALKIPNCCKGTLLSSSARARVCDKQTVSTTIGANSTCRPTSSTGSGCILMLLPNQPNKSKCVGVAKPCLRSVCGIGRTDHVSITPNVVALATSDWATKYLDKIRK